MPTDPRKVVQFLPWRLIPIKLEERTFSPPPATPRSSPPRTPRSSRKRTRGTQTEIFNSKGEELGKINLTKTSPRITWQPKNCKN